MSDEAGFGGLLILALILSVFLNSCCQVYFDHQYNKGIDCNEYEAGELNGYGNHNESIYNQCIKYKSEHFDKKEIMRITGDKGAYYYSWGYIEGYDKYLLDYENSWLIEEMENEPINPKQESDLLERHTELKNVIKIERCNESTSPYGNYDVEFYTVNEYGETTLALPACLIYGEQYNVSFGDHKETICINDDKYYLIN